MREVDEWNYHSQRHDTWHIDKLIEVVDDEDIGRILCLPIPRQPRPDVLIWNVAPSGAFSVKSAYFEARRLLGIEHTFFQCPLSSRVWEVVAPWISTCVVDWADEEDLWCQVVFKAAALGQLDLVLIQLWTIW
ncbi:hypothetical protein COLO4_15395 [Corchorus olitorius]|uniref:Uncharacterized protein n=1 Tax=Corchorus olitorius TaxID=93759 RepID=A0A1R3JN47_9ROSI|nr:hypothetical protein COLO4_15395 [Corchorus olitorius]